MKKRVCTSLLLACLLFGIPALASEKQDKKEKPGKPEVVDSGSFGVFVSGRRVATETFTIKKLPDMSVTTSEVRVEGSKDSQGSELHLTPMGDLMVYKWKETGPEKGETVVEPSGQFLVQRIKAGDKSSEQPYLMPSSTAILDDYFFSHRELLLWRYLGSGCRPTAGQSSCKLEKSQFGYVNPRQRVSGMVTLSYIGREMVDFHGTPREMSKFGFSSETGDWLVWLDDNYKLMRILVPGETTEVLRDSTK